MAEKKKTIKNKPAQKKENIVSDQVGNYEKHPFFVKKANEAKAFLKAAGLPKALAKKRG